MKKILVLTLLLCFIGTFAACKGLIPETQTSGVSENVVDNTSEKETEAIQEDSSNESEEVVELPQVLSLAQTYTTRYEWQNDIWVLYSE